MEKLDISKGFKPLIAGNTDFSIIRQPKPDTIAVSAQDIPYIRPRLLVKENDPVKIGTPIFCDKRNTDICFVSPGSGRVKKILFGPRRKLLEVIISLDENEEAVQFDRIDKDQAVQLTLRDIATRLQAGGLWQSFRQFPFKDTADASQSPPMIIVSLHGNDPFSPDPGLLLENNLAYFEFGFELLKQMTDRIIVPVKQEYSNALNIIQDYITHIVPNRFPAWDEGVVLYHLKENAEQNSAWCINAEHLILISQFLLNGVYPTEKMITVTRPDAKKPHIITRQGAPVKVLAGQIQPDSLITTGRFNGRLVDINSHLGFFDSTLNVISRSDEEEFFGFVVPGFDKTTLSRTFASRLTDSQKHLDCNLHGEERACINCGYCTRFCPVDLMPSFLMKALHSDDLEDALEYGLLDCVRCGLCSYTCPSKIELTHILSQGIDAYYKDKE